MSLPVLAEISRWQFEVTGPHVIVGAIAAAVALLCVIVHYEVMDLTSRVLLMVRVRRRIRIVGMILAMVAAHVVEVWIFALTYWGSIAGRSWDVCRASTGKARSTSSTSPS